MKKKILIATLALALCGLESASASELPVINVAKLTKDPQSRRDALASFMVVIGQYQTELRLLKYEYSDLTGVRGLRDMRQIALSPAIRSALPDEWEKDYDEVNSGGYVGLTGSVHAIRYANQHFNPCDSTHKSHLTCEQTIALSEHKRSLGLKAFDQATNRWDLIGEQLTKINQVTDAKVVGELQTRINDEWAALQSEYAKLLTYPLVVATADRLMQKQLESKRDPIPETKPRPSRRP